MADATGTQERKRARLAMPPRGSRRAPGCIAAVLGWVVFWSLVAWVTQLGSWMLLAVPAIFLLAWIASVELWGFLLLIRSRSVLQSRGVRCIVVYSSSPNWETHVREVWLSRFGAHAVTLNWSEHASWSLTLEVLLFRHFVGTRWNFNPAVLVFRGLRTPHVFRFYHAFQAAKNGRPQYLEKLEAEMFDDIGM